jgi:hypothetical protein
MEPALNQAVATLFDVAVPPFTSEAELLGFMAQKLESLMKNDAHGYWLLLYRLDIDEKLVRQILRNDPQPNLPIAKLVLDRQLQKIESRKQFRMPPPDIDDEERW